MSITRRQFLKRGATTTAGLAMGPHLSWMPGTNVSYAAGPTDAIVVFVELSGGNDGLNTVYPLNGSQRTLYEQYRPTLKLPNTQGGLSPWAGTFGSSDVLSLGVNDDGNDYALHPAMQEWHSIYGEGNLAVVPGVHYSHPSYSHFRSEVIYYTGDPLGNAGLGWFGKYMNLSGYTALDVPAVMLGGDFHRLFTPTETSMLAFRDLSNLRFPAGSLTDERLTAFRAMYEDSSALDPDLFPELSSLGATGVATVDRIGDYYKSSCGLDNAGKVEQLLVDGDACYSGNNSLVYDSPLNVEQRPNLGDMRLARDLRHVAATIRADVGARFFHVRIGGFDTHSSQESGQYHSYLLNEVSEAVGAFWREMQQSVALPAGYDGYLTDALDDQVLIVTLSEFGRTNRQNAQDANSAGTDHALAAPQFVIGNNVVGGQYGAYPDLDDGGTNDLLMVHDFRDFYGTILERWLNVAPADIGPGVDKIFSSTTEPDEYGNLYTAYNPIEFLPA